MELNDEVGIHTCPVACRVERPSSAPQGIKLGPLPLGITRRIDMDVAPGPSGAEVVIKAITLSNPALRLVASKPKNFKSGKGAVVTLDLVPGREVPTTLQAQIEFDLPARVTQDVVIEYEKATP